jgi:hypothetical protein
VALWFIKRTLDLAPCKQALTRGLDDIMTRNLGSNDVLQRHNRSAHHFQSVLMNNPAALETDVDIIPLLIWLYLPSLFVAGIKSVLVRLVPADTNPSLFIPCLVRDEFFVHGVHSTTKLHARELAHGFEVWSHLAE